MSTVPVQNDHEDHDSHHEEELHHGEPGPLRSPTFPRRAIRSASTSSATLEDAPGYQPNRSQGQPKLNLTTIPAGSTTNTMSTLDQPNRTPQYIPASPSALAAPLALSRSTSRSRPPVVGPFGSVSPDDDDGEGYVAVRSQEEADARDLRREMSRQMSRQASRQSANRGVGVFGGHGGAPVESPTSITGALPPTNNGPPSPTAHRSALPGRQASGYIGSGSPPLRQRSRGQSLIGTVADLATAGFGLGEPNEQIVQRTLSRVSTRRGGSQYPIGGGVGGTIEEKREREREEDRQSGSERTVVDATGPDAHHEKAAQGQGTDAAVGQFGGTTGGGAVNAQRMADLEKGARPGGDAPAESDASTPVDEKDEDELYMVKFEPGEKANPKNWSVAYRWYLTGAGGLLVLNSTFASSAPSGIAEDMIRYFGFSREVAILTIALFVAGYCVGPLLWGPMSESYGRRPVFIVAFLGYIGFQVGCALSKNTASILVFRFLGGTFASCPLTNAGALLADIWGPDHRGQAMAIFSLAPFAGPAIGPIVGGYIGVSGASWRWLYWVLTMFAGVCGLVVLFGIPETYTPILLVKKAGILRKETGDDRWWAPLERKDKDFKSVVQDVLVKPFKILALEPMLIAITVYMSFVYGCIYLLFEAYPIVFQQGHGFNSGASGLMFLGLFIGGLCGVIFFISVFEKRYRKHVQEYAPAMVPPEKRLHATLVAAPLLAISFFWFGWTSYPSIHWISPCMAGGLLGFAVLLIFVTLFNYIVDTYLFAAASALSANTVCRSLFGASFPLFASQMFDALNPRWASTLLGCVAVIMVPIPFVLIKFGPTLRAKSRFSPSKK